MAFEHPFSGIDPELIRAALVHYGEVQRERFPELLATFSALMRERSPLRPLACLAMYGLRVGVTPTGVTEKAILSDIDQHHVELLQAFSLTVPADEWSEEIGLGDYIQRVADTMSALSDAFHDRRFLAVNKEADIQSRTVLGLQERLRVHTQAVRNWGYFSDVVQLSTEMYAPLDALVRAKLAYSPTDIITVARSLITLSEQRTNHRWQMLRRTFRERTINQRVKAYFKNLLKSDGDHTELLRSFPSSATVEEVGMFLLAHADLQLQDLLSFTPAEIAPITGLPIQIVELVLQALSLRLGALADDNPEHFFMSNPVWRAPIIDLGGRYFCPIPQTIFSHIHDIMRTVAEAAGTKTELDDRRADFLETKVAELLKTAFPTAQDKHAVKWKVGATVYETDHLVYLDTTVIIVEDKSHALTPSGLRGAPDRVRNHVRDLIVYPSEQSARLEATIRAAKAGDADAKATLAPFGIDFSQVERIVRISVTLDDFSILASAEPELKAAGWVPADLQLATTLHVADLKCVIDILERSSFLVHYFAERGRIQKALNILADELDFLGFYLDTGFNIANIEGGDVGIALTGASGSVDRYYANREAGHSASKPLPKLRPYYRALIDRIEERRPPHWLAVTTDLLRTLGYSEQKSLEMSLLELKGRVERNWRDPEHECSLIITPPESRETAVVFFLYPPKLAQTRKERAQQLLDQALAMTEKRRCIVICRNTAAWDQPYATVLIGQLPPEAT